MKAMDWTLFLWKLEAACERQPDAETRDVVRQAYTLLKAARDVTAKDPKARQNKLAQTLQLNSEPIGDVVKESALLLMHRLYTGCASLTWYKSLGVRLPAKKPSQLRCAEAVLLLLENYLKPERFAAARRQLPKSAESLLAAYKQERSTGLLLDEVLLNDDYILKMIDNELW